MRIIVDLTYKNHIIDACSIEVTRQKGRIATTSIDLSSVIDKEIKCRKAMQKVIDDEEKELDKNGIQP